MFSLKSKAKSTPKRMVAIELSSSDLVYAILERPDAPEGETRLSWQRLPWRKEAASLATPEGRKELTAALVSLVTSEKLAGAPCQFALGGDFCVTRVVTGTNEQVQSELRTHPESVLWLNSPNQSIAVELELARPGSSRVLPPRPTGFEALQAAQAQQAAAQAAAVQSAAAEKSGSAAASSESSYLNKVRYATPQEESQVIWQRWPK